YTVSEATHEDYYTTFSGDCDENGQITLTPGETKVCNITNEEKPSKLIVNKAIINHGGSATYETFAPYKVGDTAVELGQEYTFDSGTYTVSEATHEDYYTTFSGDCDENGQITLTPGETKVCNITNEEKPSKLIVNKIVINNNGGTLTAEAFPLFVNGAPIISGSEKTLDSGAYIVSEIQQPGYMLVSYSGDCDENGQITLTPGETKVCNITNDDISPKLIVIKRVINDQGGKATASNFTIYVNGTNVSLSSFRGSENGTIVYLNPGTYNVWETNVSGYIASFSANCSGTISIGETKTCIVTNNDILLTSRSQGFWATHYEAASRVWLQIPPAQRIIGTHDMGNGPNISDVGEMEGSFWSNIAKKSNGAQRTQLDKARMALLQQLIAAMLNVQAFGTYGGDALISRGKAAFVSSNITAIQSATLELDAFNNAGDSYPFPPGFNPGKADPQTAKAVANYTFWDTLP
ncbi:MAG: hypothetical protein N3G22_00550, partial [Candidatus Micrarchaeota archaeon]|nr:hypothetical protein [Candidatus Micrarchaeota archaeon]